MKYIIVSLMIMLNFPYAGEARAWDGFDAESADLVEIIPDIIPQQGEEVEVRNHDTEKSMNCVVKSVTRNSRTIEVVVQDQNGKSYTLVMEGR